VEISDPREVALGVDFGATNLKGLLVDQGGRVHERFMTPSLSERGPNATLARIVELVESAKSKADSAGLHLAGIGIGVCGPVDHVAGEIVESPVLPGWKNVAVRDVVGHTVGLPIHLENDATVAILGEWWQGAGERSPVVAGITLGTGIGGGLVIDGRVYRGGTGFGAEFGHIQVASAPACPCGGSGCLGRVASATATLERFRQLAPEESSRVQDIRDIAQLLKHGDPRARESVAVSAEYLARAAVVLINCLNPNVFILAGGMALLGEDLLGPIREYVGSWGFRALSGHTRIAAASLGMYSGCFGAALLAFAADRVLPSAAAEVGPVEDSPGPA